MFTIFFSNVLTALAYYVITLQLLLLAKHSKLLQVDCFSHEIEVKQKLARMVLSAVILFGLFIFLCGTTHLISAVDYVCGPSKSIDVLKTSMLLVCAIVSAITALVMFKLFPLMWSLMNKFELTDEGKLELLENFMDTMNMFKESISVLSMDFSISSGNPSTSHFFGKSFEGMIVTECMHSEDVARFKSAVDMVLHTYSQPTQAVEYRIKSNNVEDEYLWVESTLCKKIGSRDYQINMITRNIDERKKALLYQEMMKTAKAEDAKNSAKLSYISCVAHDLKTPLHSFCFALDLLRDTELTEEQEELIETAEVSTDLMRLTISQTMDINKALSGKGLIPRRTTVSLKNVMRRVGIIINGYGKEVPISFIVDHHLCDSIITDEEWLWQMILNLLTNACKYTQEGSIEVGAKCITDRIDGVSKEMLLIEVRDTGVGISPDKADALFSAFGQAQEGASTGTGLGLFGLKSRVTGLGGKCGVYPNNQSSTGNGSVFWFSIPYIKDAMIVVESTESNKQKSSTIPGLRKSSSRNFSVEPLDPLIMRKLSTSYDNLLDFNSEDIPSISSPTLGPLIECLKASPRLVESIGRNGPLTAIVVDDVVSLRKLMVKILTKIGFDLVVCYENGYKGLEAMKNMEVDAVFSDVQMPVMTGPEMIQRFRQFEAAALASGKRKHRQLVIAITANGAESNNLVSENGFDHVYPKPLDVNDLHNVMDHCVLKRKNNL